MEMLTVDHVYKWMQLTNEQIQTNKDYLTELDQAIGDGDHGINMARGFKEVIAKLDGQTYTDVGAIMKDVAMTLMAKVGGASGPLYGTAFLKLSMTLKGEKVDYAMFLKGMETALDGIMQRGKATIGEKTLVDVWSPVVEDLTKQTTFDGTRIHNAAQTAMQKTMDMLATKGRAAYLRERSKGHLDPGSVSSFYLFTSLATVVKEGA